jgi:hypothetical protein
MTRLEKLKAISREDALSEEKRQTEERTGPIAARIEELRKSPYWRAGKRGFRNE